MAKAPVVYSVTELEMMDRKELLQLQENVAEALSLSQERAMQELRDKLAEAGIDAAEFAKYIGAKVVTNSPASTTRGAGRTAKDVDPELEQFKQEYTGKVIINPGHGNGKDYVMGTRGRFAEWVKDHMQDIRDGKIDVMTIEEYEVNNSNPVPGEVTPNATE